MPPTFARPDAPNVNVSEQVGIENREIAQKLNGGLSLGRGEHGERTGNLDGQWIRMGFGLANTELEVWHSLRRVPIGYIVCEKDVAASVYSSRKGSWTDQVMYLKADYKGVQVLLWVF